MKKTIAILSLVTLFSVFTAFAQDPMNSFSTKSPQKHESKHANKSIISAEKRAERMAQDLNLSADEKIKVEALFEKQDANRKNATMDGGRLKTDMSTTIESERKSYDEELARIIGADKFKQYEEIRAKRDQKRMEKRNAENNSTDNK